MSTSAPARITHQALYRRWRAQNFAQIVGQEAVVETLRNAVRLDRLAHGLLFVGPRGTGKTSMARIVAKAVNCLSPLDGEPDDECEPCAAIRDGRALDVVELDAASNNRVDDMRELLPRVYTAAADLRRKVFIIDEVQRIKEGWDVLLKTLEEPPDDVFFVFCTTDPSGIRPAVVSRLQRFTFRPLSVEQIEGKLRRIAEAEGRTVTDAAVTLLAQRAAGGMRDAESMLDQVLASGAESVDADDVRDLLGLADAVSVDRFIGSLAAGDPLDGIRLLDELERDGRDLVAFAEQVVSRLRERLLESLRQRGGDSAALARAARRLAGLDVNRGAAGGYRLQLELSLLEAAERQPADERQPANEATSAPVADGSPDPQPARPASRPPPAKGPTAAEGPRQPPEAAVPAQEPAATPPAPAPAGALEQLQAAWPQVVEQIGRNPANRPLIMACRPLEVRDGVVVLGFPESQAFLRDIAERKRTILEEALGGVLGRAVAVHCVATNIEPTPASPQGQGSDELVERARQIFGDDLLEVAEVE
ncbi:MAG TPA: DNA polymerase III subunit gamma/tau [Candidatus Limnocylindria bacterium]|nr:DNA polymerase III subunit gamma/tau [Candidatus Limnocylindria bacterium]